MSDPTILLVEDNPITRKMLRVALACEGYEVVEAGNRQGALAAVAVRRPDLLVLDYLLPDGDGLELRDEIRRLTADETLPALIVTGMGSRLAQPLGAATDIVVKPVEPSRLVALVRARLPAAVTTPGEPAAAALGVAGEADPYRQWLQEQLDRHAAQNAALLRQAAIQASALTVMKGLCEVLAEPHEVVEIVGDVLIQCLDAAGLSTGLLYLLEADRTLRLHAHCGVHPDAIADAEACFGQAPFVRQVMHAGAPVAFNASAADSAARELAARLRHTSVLVVPFTAGGEGFGAVLLASDALDLGDSAWKAFGKSIGTQFGQTVVLGRSLGRLRQLAESVPALFWLANARLDELLYASAAFEPLFGRSRESFANTSLLWREIVHSDDRQRVAEALAELQRGDVEETFRILRPDGTQRWIRARAVAIRDESGDVHRYAGTAEDVTERKRAEQRLEALSHRLLQLQEEERRTIARELHDETGQVLTSLKLMLETGERSGGRVDAVQLREMVERLMERVRDICVNLRPPMLDDLGLVQALLWHCERFRGETGIRVRLAHAELPARLPPETEIAAFRIVQEALTNVARHAAVEEVVVELWLEGAWLRVRVEDAGRGFDLHTVEGPRSGLTGMSERAVLAGGRLQVESAPGEGTRVLGELPVQRPPPAGPQ